MKKLKSGKCLTLRAIEMKASTGGAGGRGTRVTTAGQEVAEGKYIYIFCKTSYGVSWRVKSD